MNQAEFHGSSGPPPATENEPTLAERARTLMHLGGASSLATMSQKHSGYPFGSVMPYATEENGNPIFLISQMAMHTKNLKAEPRATLLVAEQSASPLGAARISLMGDVHEITDAERDSASEAYLTRHPESQQWVRFGDFGFYRLIVKDIYFVGGFGVMGWVTATDYAKAEADPLVEAATGIIQHMNEDHVESMILLVKAHQGIQANSVQMTTVDRYGFSLMWQSDEGVRGGRIGFPQQAESPESVRRILVEMVNAARASNETA